MFEQLNILAKIIGWTILIVGLLYLAVKFLEILNADKERQREFILNMHTIQCRLAYRKICRSTTDERIIEQAKHAYGAWVDLKLDVDDEEYDAELKEIYSHEVYTAALKKIEERGHVCVLKNGEITHIRST